MCVSRQTTSILLKWLDWNLEHVITMKIRCAIYLSSPELHTSLCYLPLNIHVKAVQVNYSSLWQSSCFTLALINIGFVKMWCTNTLIVLLCCIMRSNLVISWQEKISYFIFQLVDLPSIIESLKTVDKKTFYKTADISQVSGHYCHALNERLK